ncbi:MAG: type II toxin-antitoxin system RelE family toxin [Nitrosotalea sp.]
MWFAKYEDDFTREYSRLHPEIQKRTDDGIIYLQNAIDPARCGDPKKGWLKGWRSYEIGRQYRVIYKVDYDTKTVILSSVGKHKEVYHKK